MIIDSIPEVKSLSPEEKWQLAEELWDELIPGDLEARDQAIERLIDARKRHFAEHPESATTWADLKKRLEILGDG